MDPKPRRDGDNIFSDDEDVTELKTLYKNSEKWINSYKQNSHTTEHFD